MTSHIDIRLAILAKAIAAASVPDARIATKASGLLADVLAERLQQFEGQRHEMGKFYAGAEFTDGYGLRWRITGRSEQDADAWELLCVAAPHDRIGGWWADVGTTSWDYGHVIDEWL